MSAGETARRVAVIGNSNSVMQASYAHLLASKGGLEVRNFSVGGCSNVLLLDVLAMHGDDLAAFDVLVVETSVIDGELQRLGVDDAARSVACLDLFLRAAPLVTNARIVLLLIPCAISMLLPRQVTARRQYRDAAARHGVDLLDGYDLLASISALPEDGITDRLLDRALALLAGFGFSPEHWPIFLWSMVLPRRVPGMTQYARHVFADNLHLSREGHAILADLLHGWTLRLTQAARATAARPWNFPVRAALPAAMPRAVHRSNSLLTRDFAAVAAGDVAEFDVPPEWRVVGVTVNVAETMGFLVLRGASGERAVDLRFAPSPLPFEANVVMLRDPLTAGADGRVRVSIERAAPEGREPQRYWLLDPARDAGVAEVAELVLVAPGAVVPGLARAAKDVAVTPGHDIVAQPWAVARIREIAAFSGIAAEAVDAGQVLVLRALFDAAMARAADAPPSVTMARVLLAAGDLDGASRFLASPPWADARHDAMRAALADFVAALPGERDDAIHDDAGHGIGRDGRDGGTGRRGPGVRWPP